MKRIARLIGLFSTFLLLFMAAVLLSQNALRKQTVQLREETLTHRRAQLDATLALANLGPPPWPEATMQRLEASIGGEIHWVSSDSIKPGEERSWRFLHPVDGTHALEVSIAPPAAVRLISMFQRTAAALLTLALSLLMLLGLFLFWNLRTVESDQESRTTDPESVRAGLQSLRQLASVSVRQGAELERERAERLRVEEDLHIKQLLLNHALEQKIRLGQDLHDGIIQSLYATGLTLEATRSLVATDPSTAAARIGESMKALNTTIREVRAYINGLSPDALRQQTFTEAVSSLARDLTSDRDATCDLSIDEKLAATLSEETSTDLLQVVREAMSNSLRHGRATRLQVRFERSADKARLCLVDNGVGFTADRVASTGHGLENIEARIRRHHGTVSFQSKPGAGTTVECTLPVPSQTTV